ncbi:MAG: hypothetical protein NZ556_07870 [Fimbriimonadales bacterium]|nr:hypothetical protein [Fimbriimonadales bacterium]
MVLTYKNAQGDDVNVRAGTALPANSFPEERASNLILATGLAANTSVHHTSTHNPSAQQYNSIDLGFYADVEYPLRPRRVQVFWATSVSTNADHIYAVEMGVWDTSSSAWLTPLVRVVSQRRNASVSGHDIGLLPIYGTQGNGNGQGVGSLNYTEAPVFTPKDWRTLLEQSPTTRVLRFVGMLSNNTATAITGPWRAGLCVYCF